MRHRFHTDSGDPLDAHFEVSGGGLILLSRGGTKGTSKARNSDYGTALRILLERIEKSDLSITGIWVDSSRVKDIPMTERSVYHAKDSRLPPDELHSELSRRMSAVGRLPGSRGRGNPTKRLLFAFEGSASDDRIIRICGRGGADGGPKNLELLSAAQLNRVTADHVWHAVQRLLAGREENSFGQSRRYDVVADDGSRLPPKAVFGSAASAALGFKVLPEHFRGGLGTPSYNAIIDTGYLIVPKTGDSEPLQPDESLLNPDDRSWTEGNPSRVTHLRRERGSGVARAKKEAFMAEHGALHCERCKKDPKDTYGPDIGDACIEVHHTIPLSEHPTARETRLEDLMCVCANCHRILHYESRNKITRREQAPFESR